MHLTIEPNRATQPLVLGTPRDAVRQALAPLQPTVQPDEPENDFYLDDGLILGFDASERIEFIEVTPPSTVALCGLDPFGLGIRKLLPALEKSGWKPETVAGCYRFEPLGVSLYCASGKLQSVSVYKAGYYDR